MTSNFAAAPVLSTSVVVCTRNRSRLLAMCLASLAEQSLDGLEVVVVDNGSSDATAAWLPEWRDAGPHRVIVTEPVAGLSRARNRGLDSASGEVVLFLDDDALAPVSWAARHRSAYGDDRVVAVGGPIVLAFPHGRPPWAVSQLEHWWSALDHGDEPGPFPPPHGPYGTNMSVRRASALAIGGFDPALGRVGRSLLSSEEADLFERLWAAGGAVHYEPSAIIVHQVARERLRGRWLLRRGLAQGRTNARREGLLIGRQLRERCRAAAAEAFRDAASLVRLLADGPAGRGVALNDLSRRVGYLGIVAEHLSQRARAVAGTRSALRTRAQGSAR
jgi:glycosyltransferase involved in cell wall biosynthesis